MFCMTFLHCCQILKRVTEKFVDLTDTQINHPNSKNAVVKRDTQGIHNFINANFSQQNKDLKTPRILLFGCQNIFYLVYLMFFFFNVLL